MVGQVDVSAGAVSGVLRPLGGVIRRDMLETSGRRLSIEERVEIRVGLELGLSSRAIARGLGRDPATVCREVKRWGGRHAYRPVPAHQAAVVAARRPKATKLALNPVLCDRVAAELARLWSPQ